MVKPFNKHISSLRRVLIILCTACILGYLFPLQNIAAEFTLNIIRWPRLYDEEGCRIFSTMVCYALLLLSLFTIYLYINIYFENEKFYRAYAWFWLIGSNIFSILLLHLLIGFNVGELLNNFLVILKLNREVWIAEIMIASPLFIFSVAPAFFQSYGARKRSGIKIYTIELLFLISLVTIAICCYLYMFYFR